MKQQELTISELNISRKDFDDELLRLEAKFESMPPELELTVRDPEIGLEAYVVVFNTLASVGGPLGRCGKGGTRISPTVDLNEVVMLARSMTLKNAAAGLPLGGSKSAIKADPTQKDFEQKYRRFCQLVKPILVENGGTFGGFGFDIGASPSHALWACDELKSTRCFTGKPVDMGGTDYDKEGIAGLGVAVSARTAIEFTGQKTSDAKAAVQGLGAMGSAVVRYFTQFGGSIEYVSDPRIGGTVYFPGGLPQAIMDKIVLHDLVAAKELIDKGGFEKKALDDVLYQKVDVTFPCALQHVIDDQNVERIISPFLVEGANNPCSESARLNMHDRKIMVVPDFIANAGGIIAAFIEMSSSVSPAENAKTRKNVTQSKEMTEERISQNVQKMLQIAKSLDIPPSVVGRYMALTQIFN